MVVNKFTEDYKKADSEQIKEAQIKAILKTDYLPLLKKMDFIESLIYSLLEKTNGLKTYNSIIKYVSFTTMAITAYTNLEIENTLADFDLLQSSGLIAKILTVIGKDYEDFYTLFEVRLADYMREANTLEAVVSNQLSNAVNQFGQFLNNADNAMKKLDNKKINRIINQITNELNKAEILKKQF